MPPTPSQHPSIATDTVVSLKDIRKVYLQGDIEVHALRGVTLDIERSSFMAFAGPSGSGKTTLLNIVGGLAKPTSGEVIVGGRDLTSLSRGDLSAMRRDHIGFIFQSYNLVPVLTAYENAEFVLMLQGVPEPVRRERVMTLLDAVGLGGMANRFPREMSGGQQQRVAIVRAIVAEPAIILADEPTANLDSGTAAKLLDTMEQLNREQGATFLFSTHDPSVMERARILVNLKDGAIDTIRS